MLVLDGTIGCIEASESEVLDLYRSAPVVKSPSKGAKSESLEVFVSSVRKRNLVIVYLAFVADDRRIYVFTKPGKGEAEGPHQRTVQEAVGLARSMGFSPDRVDLSYSPAMREVVIRNTKIFRPHGSKVTAFLKHGGAGAPVLPLVNDSDSKMQETAPPPAAAAAASKTSTTAKGAAVVTAAAGATAAAAAAKSAAGGGAPEEPSREPVLPGAEREDLSARLQELALKQKASDAELATVKKECLRLTAERDALASQLQQTSAEKQAADADVARMEEACRAREEEKALLEQCLKQLEETQGANATLAQRLRDAEARHETGGAERSKLEEDYAAVAAERDALTKRVEAAEAAAAQAGTLQEEVAELTRRCGEAERRAAELDQALTRTGAQLLQAEKDRDAAVGRGEETDAQKGHAALEVQALQDALAVAVAEKEQALELTATRERQRKRVGFDAAGLANEALPVEEPAAEAAPSPFEEFPAPVPETAACSAASLQEEAPNVMEFTPLSDLNDFFSGGDDDAPERFFLTGSLDGIDYASPEEVVELYRSINNAYLSPDGKGQEICQGYICCLKRGESREVVAAIFGVQSGKTRVYLPEAQPREDAAYARTVRGAVSFAEEVGLMMEPVKTGTAEELAQCLERCPVLRKVDRN